MLNPRGNWRTAASYARQWCMMGTSSSHISWGHGDMALMSNNMLSHGMGHGAKSLTSISMLPPPLERLRWALQGFTAQCNPPAEPGPHCYQPSKEHASRRKKNLDKNFGTPTHPTVAPRPQEGRRYPQSRVKRVKPNKAVSRQHGAYSTRKLANCGKLRKAML